MKDGARLLIFALALATAANLSALYEHPVAAMVYRWLAGGFAILACIHAVDALVTWVIDRIYGGSK